MDAFTSPHDDPLRARALALRAQGHGNPAIRAALGLTPWGLTRLLQGHIQPEHTNLAHRAKPELRAEARDLRAQGWGYPAIARKLRVSKSTLSLWLRDLPKPEVYHPGEPPTGSTMTREEWADFCMERPERHRRRRADERRREMIGAAGEVGELSERELLLVGVMAYWCEGAKSKPWRRQSEVLFINSDPDLVRLYLRFLAHLGWGTDRVTFRLSIHERADIDAETRFWADVVGAPPEEFRKPTLKRHNPATVRLRTGDHYHGSLIVYARKSAKLYRRIEGWAKAVMLGSAAAIRDFENADEPPW